MQQIKDAGTAGIISFALVQLGFWSLSLVAALVAYIQLTGHWPDWTDPEEMSKLGAGTCGVMRCSFWYLSMDGWND